MKQVLVSTRNVQRTWHACRAIEGRLSDREIVGFGLVYGSPGLGKTMAMEAYHSRTNAEGRFTAYFVRAKAIWTETSMLKDLLAACGRSGKHYRKDMLFDDLLDALSGRPGIFLIDQVDAIAEKRTMVSILQDIHDMTGSAIMMVGEERVDAILRRHAAFYSRINSSAIARLTSHMEADVHAVIQERCDFPVDPAVCTQVFQTVGKSMRFVVDTIRALEGYARNNELDRIDMVDYQRIMDNKSNVTPMDGVTRLAVAGGGNA